MWWDLEEVHLTSFPVWINAGKPKDWVALTEYQQQVICVMNKFISFLIGYYLTTIQMIIDKATHGVKNKEQFIQFSRGVNGLEERLELLSEDELSNLSRICSDMELFAFDITEDNILPQWNGGWGAYNPKTIPGYRDFIDFLQKHIKNVEQQYLLVD